MSSNEYETKLRDVAQKLGFKPPVLNGSGHFTLVHANGQICSVAHTPSEYRGWLNTVAMLERISGQKLERPQHRKSRKKDQTSGYLETYVSDSQLAARKRLEEQQARANERVEELLEEHKTHKVTIEILRSGPASKSDINKAARLLRRILNLEEVLTEMRVPFNSYSVIPTIYTEEDTTE